MDIIYIKREIELSSLLGEELPSDVKEIMSYFKSLTFRYDKDIKGFETWFDSNDQWTIQFWEENWEYLHLYYKNWDFLREKYGLNSDQNNNLIKGMLELTLNRKVPTKIQKNRHCKNLLVFTINRKVSTPDY